MHEHRVLHIITRLIVGGAQENTMYTADLLDRSRYKVEIISGPQTGSEGSLIEEVRARDIPLELIPELVREIDPVSDCIALLKLYKTIRKNKYSIVHTHSSKAGILGRLAAWLAGTPIIIHTVHGWSFHDHMSPLIRKIYIYLERFIAHFTDVLIVVTNRDINKGILNKIGRQEKYLLIRSAIPMDEFQRVDTDRSAIRVEFNIPEHAPVLGNVGRFSAQKNPLDWIKVAGLVKTAVPDCHFLLVGDGPLRADVENHIRNLGLQDCIMLTGLRRDVPRLMSAMDVFLLTSLWEGLPRVIPQAMLNGLPVIVTGVDGSNEAIEDGVTGFVCDPGDINSLADRCIELLKYPDRRSAMSSHASEFAKREFDLNNMINKIENIYSEKLISKIRLASDE